MSLKLKNKLKLKSFKTLNSIYTSAKKLQITLNEQSFYIAFQMGSLVLIVRILKLKQNNIHTQYA